MELLDESIGAFRAEIMVGQLGAQTPSFREFKACGAPEFFGANDLIDSHRWISNAQRKNFCHKEAKVGFASCLLRDRHRDW